MSDLTEGFAAVFFCFHLLFECGRGGFLIKVIRIRVIWITVIWIKIFNYFGAAARSAANFLKQLSVDLKKTPKLCRKAFKDVERQPSHDSRISDKPAKIKK